MALNDTLHDIMYAFYKDPSVYSSNWFNGVGVPSVGNPESPRNGDFYVNVSNNDIYAFDGTSWTKVGTLGGGGALYVQDDTPDIGTPAPGYPLWLDTDEPDVIVADGTKIGNLMTEAQADCTSTAGMIVDFATAVVSGEWADQGDTCVRLTCTSGTGYIQYKTSGTGVNGIPVARDAPLTLHCVFRLADDAGPGASNSRMRHQVQWYDETGAAISVSYGSFFYPNGTTPVKAISVFNSPPNAVYAQVRPANFDQVPSDGTGIILADSLGFWLGAGGQWQLPGVPIPNTGTLVMHPNGDDVLVQRWDVALKRWQRVYYDSGWRDVTSVATWYPTWSRTSPCLFIRRVNDTVHLNVDNITIAANAAGMVSIMSLGTISTNWAPDALSGGSGTAAVPVSVGLGGPISGQINSNMFMQWLISTYASDRPAKATGSWFTSRPIPTSLPGTLVTPASSN